MMIVALILGTVIPTSIGWFGLRLIQGKTKVLWKTEQLALGWILGSTFSMFMVFLMHMITGFPLTLATVLGTLLLLLLAVAVPSLLLPETSHATTPPPQSTWPRLWTAALCAYAGWVALRMMALFVNIFTTPPFFDDTLDNWNMRGKIYFYDGAIPLMSPWDTVVGGAHSYPPTVPLMKAWMSFLDGAWYEPLVNSIHTLWFVALLALVYCTLRRRLSWQWALLGSTMLASLPVEMIQGMNAYADVFLSAHFFAAISMLFLALHHNTDRLPALRIAVAAIALLTFTKNEGWALYFPIGLALFGATVFFLVWKKDLRRRELWTLGAWALAIIAIIVVPWITYKVVNGLPFGNAKSIDTSFAWQPGVLQAVIVNTVLEGNWNILFVLFLGLLILQWKQLLEWQSLLLFLAFGLPYGAQLFAFLFTGLSAEALFQTGTARGLIHVMPVLVVLTIMLLERTAHKSDSRLFE